MFGESRKPLVVVGSINADLVVQTPRLPKPGETMAGTGLNVYPGGKGANQAAAAARLGHNTFLVAQVGTDTNAAMLRGALGSAGVDTSLITSAEGPSGTAVILLQPSGENSIIIVGGANTSDEWQITDAATAAIQSAGAVLLQREIPDVVNVIFAKIARSAGVPVILDAGGADGPLGHDLLTNLTLLSPNETELARLTGLPTANDAQVKAAAEALVASGVNRVLVKLGAQGSMLVDIYGKVVRQRAARALHIVDTTGAGDCFTAAYVVAALRGLSDEEAMRFASVAAVLCIQRAGALPSLPSQLEVEQEEARQATADMEEGAKRHPGAKGGKGGAPSKTRGTGQFW